MNSKQQGLSNKVVLEQWSTPNTMDTLPPRSPEGILKQATGARKGRKKPANLREQVDPISCGIYAGNWNTPQARDHKGAQGRFKKNGSTDLPAPSELVNKKLNPGWVEQLMGIPVGFTQLSTATKPNENRIDRLRMLGNGVVPQTARKAFYTLLQENV